MKTIEAIKNWWLSVVCGVQMTAEDALHTVGGENTPWHESNVAIAHINLTARAIDAERELIEEADAAKVSKEPVPKKFPVVKRTVTKRHADLSLAEAADKLGLAPRTFSAYRSQGKLLITARQVGRQKMYAYDDVMRESARRAKVAA